MVKDRLVLYMQKFLSIQEQSDNLLQLFDVASAVQGCLQLLSSHWIFQSLLGFSTRRRADSTSPGGPPQEMGNI